MFGPDVFLILVLLFFCLCFDVCLMAAGCSCISQYSVWTALWEMALKQRRLQNNSFLKGCSNFENSERRTKHWWIQCTDSFIWDAEVFVADKGNQSRWSHEGQRDAERVCKSTKSERNERRGRVHAESWQHRWGHLPEQWNTVWAASAGSLWSGRWDAEPLIICWQDNAVPCCLFRERKSFRRVVLFSNDCGNCRSNKYFWGALPLLLFVVLLFLTSIIRSVAMHAKREVSVRESFHLCMISNPSAGGGGGGGRGCLQSRRMKIWDDVRYEATGVTKTRAEVRYRAWGEEGEELILSASVIWFSLLGASVLVFDRIRTLIYFTFVIKTNSK